MGTSINLPLTESAKMWEGWINWKHENYKRSPLKVARYLCSVFFSFCLFLCPAWAGDLDDVRARGVLRHLGIPYANFITGSGDGLDVELIQLFAKSLGVEYEFVPTTWKTAIGDLTGRDIVSTDQVSVRGDLLANGFTILDWRKPFLSFSIPTFPSQVWLVAGAKDPLVPIVPGAGIDHDISLVKDMIGSREVMGIPYTCLDPKLYGLDKNGAGVRYFEGRLNDLAPAIINKDAELILMDVPDALVALEKWPGQIKVIGPVSRRQKMAVAFNKKSIALKNAFDRFFMEIWAQGTYQSMIEKYYPVFPEYYPDFFEDIQTLPTGELSTGAKNETD